MAKKRDRLTVDPAIGVMDLQRVLMKHMELQPEKDLWALLKHPTGGAWSWKTVSFSEVAGTSQGPAR